MTTPEGDALLGELAVRLETEGGIGVFPGLSRPVELTTRDLDPADEQQLRVLVAQAFGPGEHAATPSAATRPAGGADVRTYTLTVTADGGPPRRLSVRDPVPDGPVHALIRRLQEHRRAGG
jgi:hypothetical protein